MNAGKTSTLLQSDYNYRERGMRTVLFTPIIDTRFAKNHIASRIGLKSEAVPFDPQFDFFTYIQSQQKEGDVHCILVDEAQFLTKAQVASLCRIVDELKVPVLTYGLRTDFRGEPFEGSIYLLAWADNLFEIKSVCHCGKKAIMVIRMDANGQPIQEGPVIDIGGNEKYVSVCRKHYYSAF